MSISYALIVADNSQSPRGSVDHPGSVAAAQYEAGHSERQVTGWVAVGPEGRWGATLAVPMTGDQSALLTIERTGPTPAGAPEVCEVELVVPPGELDALLTLLRGVVAQARRDGVLVGRRGRAHHSIREQPDRPASKS